MIEINQPNSKEMESALKALEQAKARVANERKKLNEQRRKEENHHKYLMGGIVVKYFPECYQFEEAELNQILHTANEKGERNLHIHVLLTMRPIMQDGTWEQRRKKSIFWMKKGNVSHL